jgi:cytochrome c oxidase subunit 1
MTAIPHSDSSSGAPHNGAHAHDHGHDHGHHEIPFLRKYIFSTDHKIIGIEFLFLGLTFFVIGGLLAMLIRWQLGWPAAPEAPWIIRAIGSMMGWTSGPMPTDTYSATFTMHATLMIFFVIIPILVGAFGNYLIPLMIGAEDMAFPFLNGMAFWAAVPAGAIMVASFYLPGLPAQAGWTSYPPLSSIQSDQVKFRGHVPYRGVIDYTEAKSGLDIAHLLRLKAHGLAMSAPLESAEPDVLKVKYTASYWELRDAAETALIRSGFTLTAEDEESITGTAPDKTQATIRVGGKGEGVLSIKVGAGDRARSAAVLAQMAKEMNWQSDWPLAPLLMNFLALFLAISYICAYYVKFGNGAINALVSIIIALTGAFWLCKGVQYLTFDGQSCWFLSLFILGFSSLMGAVNYLTTVIKLRCPGMTMFRMPLSVWALFITSLLVLLATPVLAATLLLNLLDHHRLTSFFLPFNWTLSNTLQNNSGGGYPLLHQHLFWFYSHPAVYIMILPAMGMVSDILAVNSRKPVFGYRPMVYALSGIAFLGFIVWAHHMFVSGLNPTLGTTFAISTMFIAVPSAIKTFNWLGTLWGGNIRFTAANCSAIAFVSMFVVGGLSGIYMASTAVDVHIHDTYFIVAHIHYVLFGSSMFGIFAAIYFWYPKMFGRMMNEKLGMTHFILSFITFNTTFFPMHILGLGGMARRIYDYHNYATFAHFDPMNKFISVNAFILGAAQIPFVLNFVGSWIFGRKAGPNPWHATTLEWETPSPPPHGNFATIPVVHHGPYEYASPDVEEDWLAQTRVVGAFPVVQAEPQTAPSA